MVVTNEDLARTTQLFVAGLEEQYKGDIPGDCEVYWDARILMARLRGMELYLVLVFTAPNDFLDFVCEADNEEHAEEQARSENIVTDVVSVMTVEKYIAEMAAVPHARTH